MAALGIVMGPMDDPFSLAGADQLAAHFDGVTRLERHPRGNRNIVDYFNRSGGRVDAERFVFAVRMRSEEKVRPACHAARKIYFHPQSVSHDEPGNN